MTLKVDERIRKAYVNLTDNGKYNKNGKFCRHCGAGIGDARRDGEGTCPECDPPAPAVEDAPRKVRKLDPWASGPYGGEDATPPCGNPNCKYPHGKIDATPRTPLRDQLTVLCDAASLFGARVLERNPSWFEEKIGETDFAEANDRLSKAIRDSRAALRAATPQPASLIEVLEAKREDVQNLLKLWDVDSHYTLSRFIEDLAALTHPQGED